MSCIFHTAVDKVKANAVPLGVAAGLMAAGIIGNNILKARKAAAFRAKVAALDKSVVHIFSFPRMTSAPNLAPPAVKLEAFCRVNKVPYVMHFLPDCPSYSPTETAPFIALNGQLVGDTQFCIDHIKSFFNLPQSEGLTPEAEAISTLIRRTCDLSLAAHNSRTTMVDNPHITLPPMADKWSAATGFPRFVVNFFLTKMRQGYIARLNASGLGWLSDANYQVEYLRDVRALSAIVHEAQQAGRKYLFGDRPTTADCVLYGTIACVNAYPKMEHNTLGFDELRNDPALQHYAKQFEESVFPDLKDITPSETTGTQEFLGKRPE
eukprot:CAMPEP_0174828018 /NCGR_PEP_ID=MMETSP1114-20130205/1082_1 /TAXON_ID=312471 /ORGANISM="Neobodo designis, Strain CCAP 1951/1" /LENGTH=321 /DNA_ID=CAMNT_0016061715 /DNA_START=48 /DNA_END=1013 /DNA_ORIENTATION=+